MQKETLESYFKEQDREKRKLILEKEQNQQTDDLQAALCRKIWERRYADRIKEPEGVDYFIRALMVTGSYSKGTISRMLSVPQKIKKDILHNLFLDDIGAYGEEGKAVLYQEFCNCARFYFRICRESRSYSTKAFGLVGMSEKELEKKIGKEIKAFVESAVPALKLEKEMESFAAAFRDVFLEDYPESRHLFSV